MKRTGILIPALGAALLAGSMTVMADTFKEWVKSVESAIETNFDNGNVIVDGKTVGANIFGSGKKVVEGSKQMKTKAYKLTPARKLVVGDHLTVTYSPNETSPKVTVTAPDNLLPYIEVVTAGGEARIRVKKGYRLEVPGKEYRPTIVVSGRGVEQFQASMASTISMGYDVMSDGKVSLTATGASRIVAYTSVTAPEVEIEASGASSVMLSNVNTATLVGIVSGASKVGIERASATGGIGVNASGASDLTIKDIAAVSVDAAATGASSMELSGAANNAELSASGASHLNASGLRLMTCKAEATGASSVNCNAYTLSSNATGQGTVTNAR